MLIVLYRIVIWCDFFVSVNNLYIDVQFHVFCPFGHYQDSTA